MLVVTIKIEQEKQEKLRQKHNKSRRSQEEQSESKNSIPISLKQAEYEVFSLIQKGHNYRDITQQMFNISEIGNKRFSISQISKIKTKFTEIPDSPENPQTNSTNMKVEIFKLLRQGRNLQDIVMSTNSEPREVKSAFYEYLDLNGISGNTINIVLKRIKSHNRKFQNDSELAKILDEAFIAQYYVDDLFYYCSKCNKPVYIGPGKSTDWKEDTVDAMNKLRKDHWHHECGCHGPHLNPV